jgi:tRNA threonylcarbamoyl adenosine modification protein YeaZ
VAERTLALAIDTATRHPTLALFDGAGTLGGVSQWTSQHRHGEELLPRLDELLGAANAKPADLDAVVVGLGPGSFTGLRIGLATAKTIAYSLEVPLVGVSTTEALALAAPEGDSREVEYAVTLPAGAKDRYIHRVAIGNGSVLRSDEPRLVVPGPSFEEACSDAVVVAIDLESADDLIDEAIGRGEVALRGLAFALATMGTKALDEGRSDDIERLVPAYVALPRGIAKAAADMTWSPDLR